jgi:hypothetical protein
MKHTRTEVAIARKAMRSTPSINMKALERHVVVENLGALKTWLLERQEFERAAICCLAIKFAQSK